MRPLLLLAALTLPATPAAAQTVSVNIDVSVQFPAITQTAASLVGLLSQGVQVSFLTLTSQPAATLNKTGGITITGRSDGVAQPLTGSGGQAQPLSTQPVTQVQVTTPIPGTTQVVREVYPLAQPLSLSKPISAQSIVVRAADGQQVPLTNVMGRQAAWAKAPGLQKKLGGMPPGQLKQLCKKEPGNALCRSAPASKASGQKGNGKNEK